MSSVALEGSLTVVNAVDQHARLRDLLAAGQSQLDLSAVTECDTAGVQLLIAAQRAVQTQGGQLRLLKTSGCVRDVLQRYGLETLVGV